MLALPASLLVALFFSTNAFKLSSYLSTRNHGHKDISMHFEEAITGNTALPSGALAPRRYIATNRFKVRGGSDAKFEKRWADRTSRIASLPGFRFFTLMRRVEDFNAHYEEEGSMGNYISLTVWEDKDAFDAWRTGDAFKEAHGGGGITDFIKLLTTAIFILDGGPKPAFYDGLLPLNGEQLQIEAVNGWRKVEADGKNLIPPDIFVAQNRFKVTKGFEIEFEKLWAKRESELKEYEGFVFFSMLRRDATQADDGYNYISMSAWKNRESFAKWQENQKSSHGSLKSNTVTITSESSTSSSSTTTATETTTKTEFKVDMKAILQTPPKTAFYEGKLALMSTAGA